MFLHLSVIHSVQREKKFHRGGDSTQWGAIQGRGAMKGGGGFLKGDSMKGCQEEGAMKGGIIKGVL